MKHSSMLARITVPLATLAALACGGDDLVLPSDGSALIQVASGNEQTGPAGSPLGQPVKVQLVDPAGNGIPDRPVSWVVASGGGSASPATAMTDGNGYASATWTLGDPGPNSLSAVVSGVGAVTFTAMASGGTSDGVPNAGTSTVSADPASIAVGQGSSTIRVTVRDAAGVPVSGAGVALSASGSGNTVNQPSGPTGADGVATGTLSSTVPGTKDVVATVNGTLQINQTAQVTVASSPAAKIKAVEGKDQRAAAGAEVPVRPAVQVTNTLGQPVVGFEVTFVVTEGGGSVTGASQITNADGIARVDSWRLGAPGKNTLEAQAGSLKGSPVVFKATATSEPPPPPPPPPPGAQPHHFVFRVPPHDVNEDQQFTVEVAIVDAAGNVVPLSGIEIYVGIFREGNEVPSNRILDGDRFRDTQNGVAAFNLKIKERGRYRLRALSDELPQLGPHGPEPWLYSGLFNVS